MTATNAPLIVEAPQPEQTIRLWPAWADILKPDRWPLGLRVWLGWALDTEHATYVHEREMERQRRLRERNMKQLAKDYVRILSNSLTAAGGAYVQRQHGEKHLTRVQFAEVCVSSEGGAIWLRVDTARLPFRLTMDFLMKDEVLLTLSGSCLRKVEYIWDIHHPENGFWYLIELGLGARGIPRNVEYREMLRSLPANAGPLTFPLGKGVSGKLHYDDLAEMPHLLVGGSTGMGKSAFIRQLILTLAARNSPERLQLYLVDMKGGVELEMFATLPHLAAEIIDRKEGAIDLLRQVNTEVEKRFKMLRQAGVVDIRGYNNANRSSKLPFVVVVIDELANLMLANDLKKEAEELLADIAARSRATGVHLVACTQRPDTSIVTGLIKVNFPARAAFRVPSIHDSRTILGNSDAIELEIPGRMILAQRADQLTVQTPFMTPTAAREMINSLAEGDFEGANEKARRHPFTLDDYLRYARDNFGGKFIQSEIYAAYRYQGVTKREILNAGKEFDGRLYVLDEVEYKLYEANNPASAYMMPTSDILADDEIAF